ncbi:hypothetical protein HDU97_003184 [Phlyctochytrium planicorne]|nr:hypothetical protein HDU97_003184 [Phlyctochytrium planicorne]
MFFGHNYLTIHHAASGTSLSFSALDALTKVDTSPTTGTLVQVSYAEHWAARSLTGQNQKLKGAVKPYDWTYTTDYDGTLTSPNHSFEPTTDTIDIERLKRQDPILFYDEVVLYEDELDDNGACVVNVRVRVMPSCFLILLRYFLRVDDVLFRMNDTRVYHEFGTQHVIREYTSKETNFTYVKDVSAAIPWSILISKTEIT